MTNPTTPSDDLAAKVFHAIAGRYHNRANDLARFTATRYSFEEWLNWEAFAACSTIPEWEVHPKPSYCALGVDGCRDFGDLLVVADREKVLVEIGLVHDGTGDKWRVKLDWDVQKLARPIVGVTALHIVVLVSDSDIETSEVWQRWLAKLACWQKPTVLATSETLPPNGVMQLRGWVSVRREVAVEHAR